jgi:hypothetical protein
MTATTLHIYPTPQHLVQASYAYQAVDEEFGVLRCIRSQFPGYGFPRRYLLGSSVNRERDAFVHPDPEKANMVEERML